LLSAFADPAVDFIGGTTLPNWSQPPPVWLPPRYPAVIGGLCPGLWMRSGNTARRWTPFLQAETL